jgi:ribonuclease M5
MNKHLYIVEGPDDQSKLNSIGADFIIRTNGLALTYETVTFIYEASKVRPVVLVLDPDGPGREIRARIKKNVPDAIDINLAKDKAVGNRKVGVAEADFKYLKSLILPLVEEDNRCGEVKELKTFDLAELHIIGYDSDENKAKIKELYHIEALSSGAILERLNILKVSKQDLQKALENHE